MTKERNDDKSTPFGLWIRKVKELDSALGFTGNNLDFFWRNYKTEDWMLLEEKSYMACLTLSQSQNFPILHNLCKADKKYKGFYILTLENTTPDDGQIYLSKIDDPNLIKISKENLIKFLKFKITYDDVYSIYVEEIKKRNK